MSGPVKCCAEGCPETPKGGKRFYRVSHDPNAPWVCEEHKLFLVPQMQQEAARYDRFFQEQVKQ